MAKVCDKIVSDEEAIVAVASPASHSHSPALRAATLNHRQINIYRAGTMLTSLYGSRPHWIWKSLLALSESGDESLHLLTYDMQQLQFA